ncbi:hypothetical protein BaRGS_00007379 [Batillaria attramentaria]|uniref:Transmembrane protein n=1 Tax=Batillaria attramentaria TaxID=370345 RepID=A0ABD0LP54_9CAEN
MAGSFSTAQKLSLAGMFIGSMLCFVGLGAPYWLVSHIQIEGLGVPDELVGGSVGVFMVCLQALGEEECLMIDMNDDIQWLYVPRICGSACVLVGGICGLVALCLACCGRGSRFLPLGVVCFLAAAAGAVAPAVFAHNMDVFTTTVMNVHVASYGWAFYLYCSGVGLLGLTSIMACFSAPENPIGGMVLGHPGPAAVIVTQTGAHPYLPMQEPGALAQVPGVAVVNTQNGY